MAAETVSYSELGRRLGVSPQAIAQAVTRGRLARSVGRDAAGRPCIADVAVAEQEWAANRSRPTACRRSMAAVEAVPRCHLTVTEHSGLMVLANVLGDEHQEFDPARDRQHIAMDLTTAAEIGAWLHSAAVAAQQETHGHDD